jgi:hypothetical protein
MAFLLGIVFFERAAGREASAPPGAKSADYMPASARL